MACTTLGPVKHKANPIQSGSINNPICLSVISSVTKIPCIWQPFLISFRVTEKSDALTFTLLNTPLCFSPIMFGIYYAVFYVVKTVGGLCLTLLNACGVKEGPLLLLALGSEMAYQIAMAFVYRILTAFLCT